MNLPTTVVHEDSLEVADLRARLAQAEQTIERLRSDENEERLRQAQATLEQHVAERTAELQQVNRTLKALKESSQAMLRARSEAEYLKEVCQNVIAHCGHALVWIGLAEHDEPKTVRPVASAGFEAGYLESLAVSWADTERGRGPTGAAIRTGQPSGCQDMSHEPSFAPWRTEALKRGYASSLALPLLDEGKAFGAITLYSRQAAGFTEDEIQLLSQLADDVAYCIRSLRTAEERRRAEEQLRLLSTAVESAANGVVITDREARILWSNPAFTRLTGYTQDESVGQPARLLKSGAHPSAFYRQMWETILCGEPWQGEMVNRRKDGSLYCEEITITPVRASGEEITHFVAIKQDVTARKRAEQRSDLLAETAGHLLQSESPQRIVDELCRRLMTFLDCQVFFNFLVDEAAGQLHLNACAGIPEEEARKIEWLDYGVAFCGCAARDARRMVGEELQHSADPRAALVKSYGVQAYACHPLIIQGRVLGTLSFGTRTRARFAEDELALMQAVTDQVAIAMERRRTQEALQRANTELEQRVAERTAELGQSEARYRSLVTASAQIVWITNPAGEIVAELPTWQSFTGQTFEQYRGAGWAEVVHPEDRERTWSAWRGAVAARALYETEYRMRRHDGQYRQMLARGVPIVEPDGSIREWVGTCTDVTERKEAEAELARHRDHLELLVRQRTSELEATNGRLQSEIAERQRAQEALQRAAVELKRSNGDLEQFAYIASHDLQEPLRAVGGYVNLLGRRFGAQLDPKAFEYINGAAEGAMRMERLITDLLAFSRVGTKGGDFVPSDLNLVLNEALRNLQTTIRTTNAQIQHDPLPTLCVDATQVMQLFQNLVGNALKFRGEQVPEIYIGARREGNLWTLCVRDNGIGIEPQYFERIFQIFQRLHTRKHYPGTGIGLAICKKIVERHGGAIWVESEPGAGSAFCFTLPEAPLNNPPAL